MPGGLVRTTLSLPADLLEAADRVVRDGKARSRNAFVAAALRRELATQRRAEIDADLAAMAEDADYQREAAQIMAESAVADAEAARLLGTEHGPYPYDEDEPAEREALSRSARRFAVRSTTFDLIRWRDRSRAESVQP